MGWPGPGLGDPRAPAVADGPPRPRWLSRKLTRAWRWIVLIGLLLALYFDWFVPSYGWGGGLFAGGGLLAAEVVVAAAFLAVQVAALLWLLGRARIWWVDPHPRAVSLADYRGHPRVLERAAQVAALLRTVRTAKHDGGEVPRGLLLIGPPGSGKSYLAQAIATEAGVPFCYVSAPSLRSMRLGARDLRLLAVYATARRKAREFGAAVVFIDEIDAIGGRLPAAGEAGPAALAPPGPFDRGGPGILAELVLQLDPPNLVRHRRPPSWRAPAPPPGPARREPVLTIAASARGDLDPALLGPGRLDRAIVIGLPDTEGRVDLLQQFLREVPHDPGFPVGWAAAETAGYTAAMIRRTLREAVLQARLVGSARVGHADFARARHALDPGAGVAAPAPDAAVPGA